jgi:hypothetical protein
MNNQQQDSVVSPDDVTFVELLPFPEESGVKDTPNSVPSEASYREREVLYLLSLIVFSELQTKASRLST